MIVGRAPTERMHVAGGDILMYRMSRIEFKNIYISGCIQAWTDLLHSTTTKAPTTTKAEADTDT